MRVLVACVVVAVTRVASADTSINLGLDLGGVIGHGPLVARFDPISSAGVDATVIHGDWMIDGGFSVLASYSGHVRDGGDVADLDAIGFTGGLRRNVASSDVGATFVGLGWSTYSLWSSREMGGGRAWGPKVTLGLDYVANVRGRRVGVVVAATYQWLAASLDGSGSSHGGFTGLQLTLLQGYGTQ